MEFQRLLKNLKEIGSLHKEITDASVHYSFSWQGNC